jgi:hypothetical protein
MLRSAISAFTRVFDAPCLCGVVRCWSGVHRAWRLNGSRLCGAARRALHRVRDTRGNCSSRSCGDLPVGRFVDRAVQSPLQKYFCFRTPQITSRSFGVPPHRGAYRDRHGRGVRMRWTRQRFARDGIAGRVDEACERSTASGRGMLQRTAKSCGPDAPTLASSSRRQVGPTGLRHAISADDGGKQARSPGRARRKPLKPLRAGMPGDSGVLVVTRVRFTTIKCTRDRGCSGHPAFPTPSKGAEESSTTRAHCVAGS